MKRILILALVSILSSSCLAEQHPGAEEFAAKAAEEYNLDPQEVLLALENARFKQSIVAEYESMFCISFDDTANGAADTQLPNGVKLRCVEPLCNLRPSWIQLSFREHPASKDIKRRANVCRQKRAVSRAFL
jgi:hypothetical protein